MNKQQRYILEPLILVLLLASGSALAQDDGSEPDLVPDSAEGLDEGTQPGWHPFLKFSGNFALGHNKNVPGSPPVDHLTSLSHFLSITPFHSPFNTFLCVLASLREPFPSWRGLSPRRLAYSSSPFTTRVIPSRIKASAKLIRSPSRLSVKRR